MRKALLFVLALSAAAAAVGTAPRLEAATCSWQCGICGPVCPCGPGNCPGPPRILCVCG